MFEISTVWTQRLVPSYAAPTNPHRDDAVAMLYSYPSRETPEVDVLPQQTSLLPPKT